MSALLLAIFAAGVLTWAFWGTALVLLGRVLRAGVKHLAVARAIDALGGPRFRIRGMPARLSVSDNALRLALSIDVDLRRLPLAPSGMSLRLYGHSVLAAMPCPWLGRSIIEFVRQAAAVAESVRVRRPSKCPVCGAAVGDERVECVVCRTPHHEDCWSYNGGTCAIYACRGPRATFRTPPTTPRVTRAMRS